MAPRFLTGCALAAALSCSSSTKVEDTTPTDTGAATHASSSDDRETTAERLTEADCMAFVEHLIAVAVAEKPEEARPTAEQLAEYRSGMVDAAKQDCVGQPRSGPYDCAMKATTAQAIDQCIKGAGGPK